MRITLMTHTTVEQNRPIERLHCRRRDSDVEAFLVAHLERLQLQARKDLSPCAEFSDPAAYQLFDDLQVAGPDQFLEAARELSIRLVAAMDGRSAPGLLVFIRAAEEGRATAAVLKLEVATRHGALLRHLDTGETTLSAALDVLDAPGHLQKGALVDDPRPNSQVIIGDRLPRDALYFPRALGIRPESRASDSAAVLVEAVHRHRPDKSREVAQRLPTVGAGRAEVVLAEVLRAVGVQDAELLNAVARELADRSLPVVTVDTAAVLRESVVADGVTISGPTAAMARVRIERDDSSDGWRVVVPSTTEPRRHYKK